MFCIGWSGHMALRGSGCGVLVLAGAHARILVTSVSMQPAPLSMQDGHLNAFICKATKTSICMFALHRIVCFVDARMQTISAPIRRDKRAAWLYDHFGLKPQTNHYNEGAQERCGRTRSSISCVRAARRWERW